MQQRTDSQEQSRAALDAQWEDRLRQERSALKAELDSLHAEEKHLAVESVRVQLEQELQTARQEQEQTVRRLEQEVGVRLQQARKWYGWSGPGGVTYGLLTHVTIKC